MNLTAAKDYINSKRVFYITTVFILAFNISFLFFYAHLMPLHPDEAGYWFNFTDKALANRNAPNLQIPNHSLSIYMAKWSLSWFGNNGVGYRFPVILFGTLDALLFFLIVRRIAGSAFVAALSSSLLMVLPWFLHYSHELRGYPPYLFFVLGCYYALHGLLTDGNRLRYWAVWLISFLGCYYSNLAAIIFIFNLMVTIWILKIGQLLWPESKRLSPLKALSLKPFLIFSSVVTAIFLYIVFVPDSWLIFKNREYQESIAKEPFFLALDIFSTYLGYTYIKDSSSMLYHYPFPLFLISLVCFLYGLGKMLKEKDFVADLFVVLFGATMIFTIMNFIQVRALVYLLPFILMFQALGLIGLSRIFIAKIQGEFKKENALYGVISGVLLLYFAFLSIGKYQNLDAAAGNPYEQVRNYLEDHSGPNDLIISSIQDTITAFYFGKIIRNKIKEIILNQKIDKIFYITDKSDENYIQLKLINNSTKNFINLKKMNEIKIIKNTSIRAPQFIQIYHAKLKTKYFEDLSDSFFKSNKFWGPNQKTCIKKKLQKGIRLNCEKTKIICSNNIYSFPQIQKGDFQIIFFSHQNDQGTKIQSIAALNIIKKTHSQREYWALFEDTYIINQNISNIDDLDIFAKKVDFIDPSLHSLYPLNNSLVCIQGDLFRNNSVLKKLSLISFEMLK